MADTRMTHTEREAFLAGLHVGVLSIPRGDAAPLSAPVWYDYAPDGAGTGELWLLTGPDSRKGRLLAPGVRITLVAQQEAMPYAYVSVEGTVTELRDADVEADARPMARRYLGERDGDAYTAATAEAPAVRVAIRPDRWLTVDYGKVEIF
jgi:nitroimidazol reductase NimA-like FMN-containing flavoprotein (pyridoxamine 5'-phosphate oxidase superfamily)